MCADKYGLALYPYLTGSKSDTSSSSTSHNEEIPYYVDVEDYVAKRKGETPNHLEQYLAILYAKNPQKSRHLILAYYGWYLDRHGLDAKAGTDEALFSTSHWGHFGAARGPILYFALKYGDEEVVSCMVRVWRMMMAAAQLLRTPRWEIVSPGARFLGNANQMKECNRTFEWLATGKTQIPENFNVSPSYLGLHALVLVKSQFGIEWLRFLDTITPRNLPTMDLPPLKNPLIVHRSESGHVAQFISVDKMLNPARWAMADYRTGKVVYGLDLSVVVGMQAESLKAKKKYKLWPDEVEVRVDSEAPQCPGSNVKEYRFPVAGR